MDNKQQNHALDRQAVAVRYNPNDYAPRVVAKGAGYVHDRIIEKAKENQVAVYSDPELVKELTKIDLGDAIPPELYQVVAEVLIFISDLDRLYGAELKP